MSGTKIAIVRVGMTSALGLSALQSAASVRAGLSGYRQSSILDDDEERITMAFVPEEDLPELSPSLHGAGLSARKTRMVRLAGLALPDCVSEERWLDRTPMFLAVPDAHPGLMFSMTPDFLQRVSEQSSILFDLKGSRLYPHGRAGGFLALRDALVHLRAGKADRVIVGGVDSFVDLMLLATLVQEKRVRALGIFDGFTPGEGAAFALLMRAESALRDGREILALVDEAACADEPGHRYSDVPYHAEALDLAIGQVFAAGSSSLIPVQTIYSGFNGEHFSSKEWAVASLRHRSRVAEHARIEHPADCLGDTGAALGPMMMVLATLGIARKVRRAPCLLWCSSDKAERGAALLHAQ